MSTDTTPKAAGKLEGAAGDDSPAPAARVGRVAAWTFLIFIIVISIFPFYWALRTGLSNNGVLLSGDGSFLPPDASLINFQRVLGLLSAEEAAEFRGTGSFDFGRALRNSIIIATCVTFFQVAFSAMAAYAFARLKFTGRDKLFNLYLAGLMVPPIFVLIPNVILIRDLNLLNTLPGVMAPFLLMTPFAVFFLRQFFLGINRSIEEAALLDGAGHGRTFFEIILPMAAPQITTLAVLTYVQSWNEYLWPLVVAGDPEVQPLTVALGVFTTQQPGTSPDWSALMAATLLAALPVLILFAFTARRLVDSIQFSGIK
ncbi:carbohydrate ABC transporter permease [Euzebya tangerina]|uniref:carbohydrate ABC transporter permease n=1 Tax=Euzebya tangerina TaxID=591198 RepID=UPI00196ACF74|nr:carbohydrate ABC transporter permease [Euzebya tangerina]